MTRFVSFGLFVLMLGGGTVFAQTDCPLDHQNMSCSGRTKTTGIWAIQRAGTTIGIVPNMCDLDRTQIHFSHLAVRFGSGTKAIAMRVGDSVPKIQMGISFSVFRSTAIFMRCLVFGCSYNSRAIYVRRVCSFLRRIILDESIAARQRRGLDRCLDDV